MLKDIVRIKEMASILRSIRENEGFELQSWGADQKMGHGLYQCMH